MNKNLKDKAKHQKGFMSIEYLIVIGLVLGGLILIFSTVKKGSDDSKASRIQQEVSTINQGLSRMFMANVDTSSLTTATAIQAGGIVPGTMLISGVTDRGRNAFGGDVTLAQGADSSLYTITLTRIPNSACSAIVQGIGNAFYQVSVNGATVKDFNQASPVVLTVNSQCSSGGTNNTLVFTGRP